MEKQLIDRFKKIKKELKLTNSDVAKKLGISINSANHISGGRTKIDLDLAYKIEEKLGVSSLWLSHGIGDMFDIPASPLSIAMGDDSHSRIQVPYYENIRAAAGDGYINSEDTSVEMISLPKSMIGKRIAVDKIEAIKVHGDSMSPTIEDGDVIFVCKKQRDIKDGDIYVLNHDGEVKVKRIFKLKGKLIIKSDNPIYPQDEASIEEISIIGNVIFNFSPL
jgi:phage repressor protein C with HTH and peptisase S24 domain